MAALLLFPVFAILLNAAFGYGRIISGEIWKILAGNVSSSLEKLLSESRGRLDSDCGSVWVDYEVDEGGVWSLIGNGSSISGSRLPLKLIFCLTSETSSYKYIINENVAINGK